MADELLLLSCEDLLKRLENILDCESLKQLKDNGIDGECLSLLVDDVQEFSFVVTKATGRLKIKKFLREMQTSNVSRTTPQTATQITAHTPTRSDSMHSPPKKSLRMDEEPKDTQSVDIVEVLYLGQHLMNMKSWLKNFVMPILV
jgi:hypothetical protein